MSSKDVFGFIAHTLSVFYDGKIRLDLFEKSQRGPKPFPIS